LVLFIWFGSTSNQFVSFTTFQWGSNVIVSVTGNPGIGISCGWPFFVISIIICCSVVRYAYYQHVFEILQLEFLKQENCSKTGCQAKQLRILNLPWIWVNIHKDPV